MADQIPELACYLLPGNGTSDQLLEEARDADRIGFGTGFLSERLGAKELAVASGAALATTTRLTVATAATNHNMRHPLVTAGMASTLHRLSGGRFGLGLGRGADWRWKQLGMPNITTAALEDFAALMRRLWHGETILAYDGPVGNHPHLLLDSSLDEDIPIGLVAFGDRTLELAGRAFDFVVLHTFFTEETLEHCVKTVKRSAEQAGRDPDSVAVWSCFATVPDTLSAEDQLIKTVGRMATYLQHYGDLMVSTNRWDPAPLRTFRDDAVVQSVRGPIDMLATQDQLEHIATLIPDEWLAPAARGTAEQCATRVQRELHLGADGVILHGSSAADLAPVVEAYRRI